MDQTTPDIAERMRQIETDLRRCSEAIALAEERMLVVIRNLERVCNDLSKQSDNVYQINPPVDYVPPRPK